ncbi:HAD-IC family P-type ATPase [Patescibacteria group bacterium]|nr:HAD-IC family P-type ATPase [Patescibacteria group bacterium]
MRKQLQTSEQGLSAHEAAVRLAKYGPNVLPEAGRASYLVIFLEQFKSPLIYLLLGASVIVFAVGEPVDSAIIVALLLFNAAVGTVQEGRAQNTLLALKKFVETTATVLREGKEIEVVDRAVVPGDLVVLEEGEKVPADARIVMARNLQIDEASLTGESGAVHKTDRPLAAKNAPLAEQKNMVFKGTHIVSGSGLAVVVAVGLETAIGKIAKKIATIDSEIPLKTDIRRLSRVVIASVLLLSTALFVYGIVVGHTAKEMFVTVVSLSVSLVPEGLPIVMTLVLATGVWRMSGRNALVKRLQAVEALGQASVIAVDKTGTVTKNELVVQKIWVADELFTVSGVGYEPTGNVSLGKGVVDAERHPALKYVLKAAALCAHARLFFSKEKGQWRIAGDPTEAALLVAAQKVGLHKEALVQENPLVAEIPFDNKCKYHATVHNIAGTPQLTIIGAPEVTLQHSTAIWQNDSSRPLSAKKRKELEEVFVHMSEEGLRVVALAVRAKVPSDVTHESIQKLTFVGFFGLKDALRPEVHGALARARSAGVRVVMITGDHAVTARAIARDAGIYRSGERVLTGADIDALADTELPNHLGLVSVFARVTPEHKLRIIRAYKERGEVVAMTGDGVNDAPSLVAADLGVAMGGIGTEVAKEAADMVLLDDNFGSIVSAIEEGRSIYQTMKKVILYLFSTGVGEALTITVALIAGLPLPVLAVQIIWLNFVTDGFLDVSLAMEPKEKNLLSSRFGGRKRMMIDGLSIRRMILMATPMMAGTLVLFSHFVTAGDMAKALTVSLTTLAVFQWFNVWNCRSETESVFRMNPLNNPFLLGATAVIISLQVAAVYTPFLQSILHTVPLGFFEWMMIIPVAFSVVVVEEARKFLHRRSLNPAF